MTAKKETEKQPAQVQSLLNERENAKAYGQDARVQELDKQLAAYGLTPDEDEKDDAASKRKAAAADDKDAKKAAPSGRSSGAKSEA